MNVNFSLLTSKGMLIASIVVPAISLTINLSSFTNLFINVDFPALGLPNTAIFLSSDNSIFISGILSASSDFNSEILIECSALIS